MKTCWIYEASVHTPSAPAVVWHAGSVSYGELNELISIRTQVFQTHKISRGQVVAFYARTDLDTIVTFFALFRIGAIAFPLNPNFSAEYVDSLCARFSVSQFIEISPIELTDVMPDLAEVTSSPEQLATLILTSGSSGRSKGCVHTLANHYWSANGYIERFEHNADTVWLASLPFFHVGGISVLFRQFGVGGTVALPSSGGLGTDISDLGVTHLSLVSTQLHRLLDQDIESDRLRQVIVGGAPVSDSLLKQARRRFPVLKTYGMTETSSMVTLGSMENTSSGQVLPYRNLAISDDGRVGVKGPVLFAGYWESGDIVRHTDENGWFWTQDLGCIEDDRLELLGRRDRVVISGGENIMLSEVEAMVESLDDVETAVAVGIPHSKWGERPVVFVRVCSEMVDDLFKNIRTSLEEQKVPRYLIPDRVYALPEECMLGPKPDYSALVSMAIQDSQ